MSEQAAELTPTGDEVVELPGLGDAAFASLMDTLAPEEDGEPAGQGGAPAGGATPAGQGTGAAGAGAGSAAPVDGQPAGGTDAVPGSGAKPDSAAGTAAAAKPGSADGTGAVPGDGQAESPEGTAGPAGDRPASWTQSAADLAPALGDLSTKYEEKVAGAYQAAAVKEVQDAYPKYFDALNQPARALVGLTVPRVGGEGTEVLRDAADAKDWQDATKQILAAEVRDRATRAMEEAAPELNTVHASIEMFAKNPDLMPGTKDFDVELANRFVEFAKPYETRVDGKLRGYNIEVQPIIDSLRRQVTAERAANPPAAPAAATPAAAAPSAAATPPGDQPQAGIPSKAGAGEEGTDMSTFWGTIGLPDLRL